MSTTVGMGKLTPRNITALSGIVLFWAGVGLNHLAVALNDGHMPANNMNHLYLGEVRAKAITDVIWYGWNKGGYCSLGDILLGLSYIGLAICALVYVSRLIVQWLRGLKASI